MPVVVTDFATAELVKVAANSFLATKISFINAMAEVCEVDRRRRHASWPRRSATTPGSVAASSTPASVSAAGACPRTSGRSSPGPASSGVDQAVSFLREVDADQPAPTRADRRARPGAGRTARTTGARSRSWGRRSSRTPTTSATPRRWTSRPRSAAGAPTVWSTTRRRMDNARAHASRADLRRLAERGGHRRRRRHAAHRVGRVHADVTPTRSAGLVARAQPRRRPQCARPGSGGRPAGHYRALGRP